MITYEYPPVNMQVLSLTVPTFWIFLFVLKEVYNMNNYKILSILRLLKSTIGLFVNSFFVMYFLNISNSNIAKLGVYYILMYAVIFITIFLCKNLCKSKNRINVLRTGIILNFIYFLLILLLKEKITNFIYLMGIIYGLEEGFYYSVYNNFESSGVSNKKRKEFSGSYICIKSIISVIIPLIFGSIITSSGFGVCTIIVLVLVTLQLIFSTMFKDNNLNNDITKTNLKEYKQIIGKDEIIKNIYKVCLLNGFIFTGAFSSIVVIYIIKVVNTSFNLGVFTSIFAIITSIKGGYSYERK